MKSQVLHTVWCYISCETAREMGSWSLSRVKGLMFQWRELSALRDTLLFVSNSKTDISLLPATLVTTRYVLEITIGTSTKELSRPSRPSELSSILNTTRPRQSTTTSRWFSWLGPPLWTSTCRRCACRHMTTTCPHPHGASSQVSRVDKQKTKKFKEVWSWSKVRPCLTSH